MSKLLIPDRRNLRRLSALLLALWSAIALPLAALPPDVFAGECVMACSLEGRECCCKKATQRSQAHGNHADSQHAGHGEAQHAGHGDHGVLSHGYVGPTLSWPSERACPEFSATIDKPRSDEDLKCAESRDLLNDPADDDPATPNGAPGCRSAVGDLATLPRPPPVLESIA